jgi:hypothetical protein
LSIGDTGFAVGIGGGVNGGTITILFRDSVDGHSSSDTIELKIRRKNEVNLAIICSANRSIINV